MDLLNENISHDDLKKYIKELYNYAAKELNIDVPPRVFLRRDKANAEDIFGKTGGYDPDNQEVHLYITDRHPKDILRSLAHELVHHAQKLQGFDDSLNINLIHQDPAYAQHDEGLREMERDAFERGNMIFRAWTDGKKTERKNIMTEKLDEKKKMTDKQIKKAHKFGKKHKGDFPNPEAAYATDTKLAKAGKLEEKNVEEMKNKAQEEAKSHMAARHGKDMKEDTSSGGAVEAVEALEENKEPEQTHPYPQLFQEKPRLMQDAFNKKEDLVYQELVRRFIKK